jgi:hypothetical protein
MVVPAVAFPAQVTIPDQRALICFSNGTERLVIETRFIGAGTNFAWVVPLPNKPVVEEATTGLFPTLQYIFRPEIVHDVPRYYIAILAVLGFAYLLWRASQCVWNALLAATVILFLMLLAALLLPALSAARTKGIQDSSVERRVSILDRKLVGIFEIVTLTARDSRALENWLRDNDFSIAPEARPVIDDYLKDGWVFVAAKLRRDDAKIETSTPHPLSFTFKTDRPVYPVRLTGLNSKSLRVDLYVFGKDRATAPSFKVESCLRPKIAHPLLHDWTAGLPVATKLAATLSSNDMTKDVWLGRTPMFVEQRNRLFSQEGALTTALNRGTGLFAAGLMAACFAAWAGKKIRLERVKIVGIVTLISMLLGGFTYLMLPKIEVKLVRGWPHNQWKMDELAIRIALGDFDWRTTAEARAALQNLINAPTNALIYGLKNWDNAYLGDPIREEDSPGNYLLRETNNHLQIVFFDSDGSEDVFSEEYLPTKN